MTTDPWTENLLLAALAERYAAPTYAFLRHVPNGTGGRADKTIDAVAMGLWPSRGLDLHGFEVKTSRTDWRRELANPAKAEGWPFDFFWLVTPLDLVPIAEVPPAWGLIEARNTGRGVRTTITKPAPVQKKKPISRVMLAALMRKVHAAAEAATGLAGAKQEGYDNGYRDGIRQGESNAVHQIAAYKRLRETVDGFTRHSGIEIDQWTDGAILGERVKIARSLHVHNAAATLDQIANRVRALLVDVNVCANEVRSACEKITAAETEPGSGAARAETAAEPPRPTDDAETATAAAPVTP